MPGPSLISCVPAQCVIGALLCLGCITRTASRPKDEATTPLRVASGTSSPRTTITASSPKAPGAPQSRGAAVTCGARIEGRPPGDSWQEVTLDRWLPAIEDYKACVNAGNQVGIGAAAVDFAKYLNRIHNRVHPIFAGSYLPFLDRLDGAAARLPNEKLVVKIEMVLSGADGSIVSMGVIASSGLTAFDVSALESVFRAAPFGAPEPTILSPDGNVYVHWQLWRNTAFACSTYFMRPYKLRTVSSFSEPKVRAAPGASGASAEEPP